MRWVTALLFLLPSVAPAAQPADAIPPAWRDVVRLPPHDSLYARYVWLSGEDPKERAVQYLTLSAHCHATSRTEGYYPPWLVGSNGAVHRFPQIPASAWEKGVLARIDLRWFGWGPELWEGLAELDPIFHLPQVVKYKAGKYSDGTPYAAGEQTTFAIAPWVIDPLTGNGPNHPEIEVRALMVKQLATATNSSVPVIDCDNFIWQTSAQFKRKVGYYDLIGVKDRDTFNTLVGFNEKEILRFSLPELEAVSDSRVTAARARRIENYPKPRGNYIQTKDSIEPAIGKRDPLTTTGRDDLIFDAFETLANGANGIIKTGLFDSRGKRQDSAPDGIGYFHQAVSNDGKIHVYFTCFACHDRQPGRAGIHPFRPHFRQLFVTPGPLGLPLGGYEKFGYDKDFERQYVSRPFDPEDLQRWHVKGLALSSGFTPDQFATYLYERYQSWDTSYTIKRMAQRLGVTVETYRAAVNTQLRAYGVVDSLNAGYLNPGYSLGPDQWRRAYNQAHLILRGLPQWPDDYKQRYR